MKKTLLLAAGVVLGIASNAGAVKLVTEQSIATDLHDGAIVALQCLDSNGGLFYFWNGATAKNPVLRKQSLMILKDAGDGKFYLQDYYSATENNSNVYLSNSSVSFTDNIDAAAKWSFFVPTGPGATGENGYSSWTTKPEYLVVKENTIRISKGGSFINTQNTTTKPSYAGGTGGYSYWYVYTLTAEEAANSDYLAGLHMVDCKYEMTDPFTNETVESFTFKALSGIDASALTYTNRMKEVNPFVESMTVAPNQIVSDENNKIQVQINWATARIEATRKASRYWMKPAANTTETYVSYNPINNELRSKNANKAFDPGHMWYFDWVSIDSYARLQGYMKSVQITSQGIQYSPVEGSDNWHAFMSTEPTLLTAYLGTSGVAQPGDFLLCFPDANNNLMWVNDRDGSFSTWRIGYANAKTDVGCIMRPVGIDDSEFEEYLGVVEDCGYDDYLAKHPNGITINETTINNAKVLRTPEAVTAIFPENMNMLNGLRTYKELVGIKYLDTDGTVSIPGYVSAEATKSLYDAIAAFNRDVPATSVAVAEARWPLVNNTPAVSYEPTPGAIYYLRNSEAVRGYLCNTDGMVSTTKSSGHSRNFDATNDDFKFTFINVDGHKYLYNIGAQKFMNAFGEQPDIAGQAARDASDYTWRFSEVPTEIRGIIEYMSDYPHSVAITGGLSSGNERSFAAGEVHEGGISMIINCNRNVLVSLGVVNRTDGSGLYTDYAFERLSEEEVAALNNRAIAAINSVHAVIPNEFDEIEGVVNHIDYDTFDAIMATNSEEQAAKNGGTLDHKHYIIENGSRQNFDSGKVYNLFVDDENAYKFNMADGTFSIEPFEAGDGMFNFTVTVGSPAAVVELSDLLYYDAGDVYTFTHNHDGVDYPLPIDGNTQHELGTDEIGKVSLSGQTLIAKVGSGSSNTTMISEMSAEKGSEVYFDLSGRRVVNPANGIFVTRNGKKIVF